MTPLDYIKDGAEIYRRSFATIRREAELSRFSPLEERDRRAHHSRLRAG